MVLLPQNYDEFVLPLIDELKIECQFKNVNLVLENQPPKIQVHLVPQRLSRVFYNLVHNAMDAMPQGGKITLRFYLDENKLITEVEDTGPGIPKDVLEHLFEPFYTFGKAHGTGLGLSISKRIIEDHGGNIWGKNAQNGGALFGFYLPIKQHSAR
jgi:signal transduction histidine kinase